MNRTALTALLLAVFAAGALIATLVIHHAALPQPGRIAPEPHASRALAPVPARPAAQSPDEVYIDPAMIQDLGVRSTVVTRRAFTASIHTTGYVDYDPERVVQVNAHISGWIQKLEVGYAGQRVTLGQTLLRIYSPELVMTQEDYLRSRSLAATSAHNGVGARQDGIDLMAAAVDRMRLWGIPRSELKRIEAEDKVSESVALESPARGVVTDCKAIEGSYIKAGDSLYSIADLSRVWVYAEIYERELPHAHLGQRAIVTSDALLGRKLGGVVTYIYPDVSAQTRTTRVRLEFQNPDGDLKPGMYVNATLVDQSSASALAVPAEAVLNSGLRKLVILDLRAGRFLPREITAGPESDGFLAVVAGLAAGDRVVTSAQFLIDSESNLHEALEAMSLAPSAAESPAAGDSR
ncbi:MAG: efflux RND transporter periplasmic adaptor subunit [Candidatus Binataceae bacterium]